MHVAHAKYCMLHVLNCVDFMALRLQFYTANNMHELFLIIKVKQLKKHFSPFEGSWSVPPRIIVFINNNKMFYLYLKLYLPDPQSILLGAV